VHTVWICLTKYFEIFQSNKSILLFYKKKKKKLNKKFQNDLKEKKITPAKDGFIEIWSMISSALVIEPRTFDSKISVESKMAPQQFSLVLSSNSSSKFARSLFLQKHVWQQVILTRVNLAPSDMSLKCAA